MKIAFSTLAVVMVFWVDGSVRAESPIRPGDRVAIVGNTFADQFRIHGYLETLLLHRWKDDPVSIRNLGWGGDMLGARDRPTGFPSEESTLTAHKTDVIIACFGLGESFAGKNGLRGFRDELEAFVASHTGKQYNGESEVRLVLVSPIACEDLGSLTPAREKRSQELDAYTRAMGEIAVASGVQFVDLFETSRYLMDERAGPNLTNNGIHLNAYGYWALSHTIYAELVKGDLPAMGRPWRLSVDLKTKSAEARGVAVSELKIAPTGISFQVAEESSPSLPPPTDEALPPQLADSRDTLFVKGLTTGNYRLSVDGEAVVTADEKGWAMGVAIDSSPSHKNAEAYRARVYDKNLQFTYSWKALNQVHIVGERRNSPSGRALPEEVKAFEALAEKHDGELGGGIALESREWRLTRVDP